jgi:hypothetical protein
MMLFGRDATHVDRAWLQDMTGNPGEIFTFAAAVDG